MNSWAQLFPIVFFMTKMTKWLCRAVLFTTTRCALREIWVTSWATKATRERFCHLKAGWEWPKMMHSNPPYTHPCTTCTGKTRENTLALILHSKAATRPQIGKLHPDLDEPAKFLQRGKLINLHALCKEDVSTSWPKAATVQYYICVCVCVRACVRECVRGCMYVRTYVRT